MALVAVRKSTTPSLSPEIWELIMKELSPRELEAASFGEVPPRLGGGGREGPHPQRGSRAYHQALQGGGPAAPPPPVPERGLLNTERVVEAQRLQELQQGIRDEHAAALRASGGPKDRPYSPATFRAMRRRIPAGEGAGGRMTAIPTHEGMEGVPQQMRGVQTADIPGAPEIPPWVREQASMRPPQPPGVDRPGLRETPPGSPVDEALAQAFPEGRQPIEVAQREGLRDTTPPLQRRDRPFNPFPRVGVKQPLSVLGGRPSQLSEAHANTVGVRRNVQDDTPGPDDQSRRG